MSRLGRRQQNEDACGYWTSARASCFVVCDGAGGHGGGEVASETAVRTLLSAFSAAPSLEAARVTGYIAQADEAVRYGQKLSEGLREMSATVAALFLDGAARHAQWSHVGDTRIYHIRRRVCRCLTRDHSVVQSFVDAGVLDAAQARSHARRNLLFAALGMGDSAQAAALDEPFVVEEGDVFLLCTDGFWDALDESRMVETLMSAESAESWLVSLEAMVIEQSDPRQDNYSALAVWVGCPWEVTQPWPARTGCEPVPAPTPGD